MNDDIFKGQWKQLKGEVRKRWNQLTDDDVEAVGGEMEKLEGRLQERYGWEKERIKTEISDWWRERRDVTAIAVGLVSRRRALRRGALSRGLLRWGSMSAPPTSASDAARRTSHRPRTAAEDDRYLLEGPHSRLRELLILFRAARDFIRGFRALHFVGPCVTVFGSARFPEGHHVLHARA